MQNPILREVLVRKKYRPSHALVLECRILRLEVLDIYGSFELWSCPGKLPNMSVFVMGNQCGRPSYLW